MDKIQLALTILIVINIILSISIISLNKMYKETYNELFKKKTGHIWQLYSEDKEILSILKDLNKTSGRQAVIIELTLNKLRDKNIFSDEELLSILKDSEKEVSKF